MLGYDESTIYTLITGASGGLGKALAEECAGRGMNLILIALPKDGLLRFSEELKTKFPISVKSFEVDLSKNHGFRKLIEPLKHLPINWLINNVGIGGTKVFTQVTDRYLQKIIDVNIRNTTLLTYHLLPQLSKHPESHILNVSSLMAQYPAAYKTVYPASKAFVYSFSLCLREELRGSNVYVSVALPGPIDSNADVHHRLIEKQGFLAKVSILTAPQIARSLLDASFNRKAVIIPGAINKFILGVDENYSTSIWYSLFIQNLCQ